MKWIFIAVTCLCIFAVDATAQAVPSDCPAGMICLTREAAQKALEAGDKAKALEAELAAQKQAYEKMRDALNDMRIQFASVSGENTALRQNAVQDRAIIEVLLKATKKKCMPFSVCF